MLQARIFILLIHVLHDTATTMWTEEEIVSSQMWVNSCGGRIAIISIMQYIMHVMTVLSKKNLFFHSNIDVILVPFLNKWKKLPLGTAAELKQT